LDTNNGDTEMWKKGKLKEKQKFINKASQTLKLCVTYRKFNHQVQKKKDIASISLQVMERENIED
jgi:hypothetical protein